MSATKEIIVKWKTEGQDEAKKKAKEMADAVDSAGNSAKNTAVEFSKIAGKAIAFTAIATGAYEFVKSAISAGAAAETMRNRFINLQGGIAGADAHMRDLTDFANESPFEIKGIVESSAALQGFGLSTERTMASMRVLGDIAAATNKPLGDLTNIFIKVQGAGKLTGETFNQLAERGINIGKAIADNMGIAESSVKDLVSKGKIGTKEFEEALKSLTAEGKVAYKGMETMGKSFEGRLSSLSDNYNSLVAILGKALLPVVGEVMEATIAVIGYFQKNQDVLVAVGGAVVGLGIAYIALNAAAIGAAVAAGAAWVVAALPIIALVAGIAAVSAGIAYMVMHWDKVKAVAQLTLDTIAEAFPKVTAKIKEFADYAKEKFAVFSEVAAQAFYQIKEVFSEVFGFIIDTTKNVGKAFGELIFGADAYAATTENTTNKILVLNSAVNKSYADKVKDIIAGSAEETAALAKDAAKKGEVVKTFTQAELDAQAEADKLKKAADKKAADESKKFREEQANISGQIDATNRQIAVAKAQGYAAEDLKFLTDHLNSLEQQKLIAEAKRYDALGQHEAAINSMIEAERIKRSEKDAEAHAVTAEIEASRRALAIEQNGAQNAEDLAYLNTHLINLENAQTQAEIERLKKAGDFQKAMEMQQDLERNKRVQKEKQEILDRQVRQKQDHDKRAKEMGLFGEEMANMQDFFNRKEVKDTVTTLSLVEKVKSDGNKQLGMLAKGAALANIAISTAEGIAKAWALGPILGPIGAGAVFVAGLAQAKSVNAQKFANGGVVNESSFSGDSVMTRLNGGEEVLTRTDRKKVRDQLNSKSSNLDNSSVIDLLNKVLIALGMPTKIQNADGTTFAEIVREGILNNVDLGYVRK